MVDVNAFKQFMEQMKGQDPNRLIQSMVQMQAKQMEGQFADVRKMLGF